ncbi:MAG: hypothetical protein BWY50_02098 [Spirochaetes bacterium ADurb.Bin315]|nr:MAG: hypothetical protein BWY50_02098 [Spirochaetes bacterium ADurb.Bin315]
MISPQKKTMSQPIAIYRRTRRILNFPQKRIVRTIPATAIAHTTMRTMIDAAELMPSISGV